MNMDERYRGVESDGGGFNPYAAGIKHYGGGRSMPNLGANDPRGYRERDLKLQARRNALLRRTQAQQQGQHMNPDVLRPQIRR